MSEFKPFKKIPRYTSEIVLTEKLDGTNASILITEYPCETGVPMLTVEACSKNRVLGLGVLDNHGFCAWVQEHETELKKLGVGQHYGEWYGRGIGRNYGLDHKRFALFNVGRWRDSSNEWLPVPGLPDCVEVVPVIGSAVYSSVDIDGAINHLKTKGSIAVPGFMEPEGVIIYHKNSNQLFKRLVENDRGHKDATNL